MTPIVIEPSVALKWYTPEVYSEECLSLIERNVSILVPDALFAQVGTALWKRVRANELKPDVARQIASNLRRLPLTRVPAEVLMKDALEISTLTSRSFQEGLYFALAIRNDTKLVTADRRWHNLVSTGPMKPYLAFITEVCPTTTA